MKATKGTTLVGLAAAGVLLAALFHRLLESMGMVLPGVPWFAVIGLGIFSAVLFLLGWRVRAWIQGDRKRELDMLHAARVAVMAKAAALTGAALVGWYAGAALHLILATRGGASDAGVQMLVAVAVCLILTVVGLIVEHFCQLPPDDDIEHEEPTAI